MTSLTVSLPVSRQRTAATVTTPAWWWPAVGIVGALALWWLATDVLFTHRALVAQFSPVLAVRGLVELARSGTLLDAAAASVFRLLAGVVVAGVVGVVAGTALGSSTRAEEATRPVQLFLKMVSPLSWAPVAVIAFGVGDRPVVALVAAATVWPILVATADGVRSVNPGHREVARSLGATRAEELRLVVWPDDPATGARRASGRHSVWAGSCSCPPRCSASPPGLGYQVLNAKDQLAYPHITALIVVIGTLGFALDVVARWALATPRERRAAR